MKDNEYIAIIIDVVNSRGMLSDDRIRLQKAMANGVDDANTFLSGKHDLDNTDDVIAFDFSGGDSVMGLVKTWEDAAAAIHLLMGQIGYSAAVRIAIGVGEWTVRMLDMGINAQDGEAFWQAREAMDRLKEKNVSLGVAYHGETICLENDGKMYETIESFIPRTADELGMEDFKKMNAALFTLKMVDDIYCTYVGCAKH